MTVLLAAVGTGDLLICPGSETYDPGNDATSPGLQRGRLEDHQ
jgi:hypothetical protein